MSAALAGPGRALGGYAALAAFGLGGLAAAGRSLATVERAVRALREAVRSAVLAVR